MGRLLSIVATAVAASIAIVDGFTVTTRPVIAMDPTAPHQVLEQYYDVGQQQLEDLLNHEALRTLKISVPGRVFVSVNYDFGSVPVGPNGPTQAATVRFSGNSEDIFKYFEVVSPAPHTLEVRRRPSVRGSLSDVYMLTEISLAQSQQISEILANGAGDIVIEDRVLVGDNQNDLKLQLSGSGDVFIDSTSSRLAASVEVASQGSGDIYWTTRSLQTSSLKLGLAGSGDFTWTSQMIDSTSAEIAKAGSGDVCVAASVINTNTMKASVVGSGSVSFSAQSGRCSNEEISVLGSGDILLGDIQCNDVNVALAASGDIYVQAVQSIYGSAFGSGDIRYVGVTPNKISDRRDKSAFSTRDKSKYKPIAKRADHNRISTCIVPPVPLREATLVTSAAFASGAVAFGPLIFFALISLCYLRSQRKPRRARGRGARFTPGAQATEMHPLMAAPPQQPYQPAQQLPYQQAYQQPYQPQRQQQQQQQQQQQKQNQVYV